MPSGDSPLLPDPPPPRPAGRDEAIAAALRRFDGAPAAAPEPRASRAKSWTRHPQLGLALAASLVVIIGFPAAFIVLRDQGSTPAEVSAPAAPPALQRAVPPGTAPAYEAANALAPEPPTEPRPIDQLAKVQSVAPAAQADQKDAATADATATNDVPAAPPPPPTPPPAPPAPAAEKSAEEAAASGLVVTGSRIAQPNSSRVTDLSNREQRGAAAARAETDSSDEPTAAHRAFVTGLQAAVRANDRSAVIALIDFPLRVNSNGRSQFYRDASGVRSNYERIFTPKVTRAILGQRPDTLFGNQYGWMIGNGAVWFDQTCRNQACSPPGPIRITSINL